MGQGLWVATDMMGMGAPCFRIPSADFDAGMGGQEEILGAVLLEYGSEFGNSVLTAVGDSYLLRGRRNP